MSNDPVFRVRCDGRPWLDEPHQGLARAVRSVLGLFTGWSRMSWGMVIPSSDPNHTATLYRRPDATVHVVGEPALAADVRRLFPLDGWQMYTLPPRTTPLEVLHDRLGRRVYNLLKRSDFTTIEEVAAVPDSGLLSLRGLGQDSLLAIRSSMDLPIHFQTAGTALDSGQTHELGMLLGALAGYAERAGDDQIRQRAVRLAQVLGGQVGERPAGSYVAA